MPEQYAAPAEYTDAELLVFARGLKARILATGAQEYYIGDKRFVMPPLAQVEKTIADLEQAVANASGGSVNLARMRRAI